MLHLFVFCLFLLLLIIAVAIIIFLVGDVISRPAEDKRESITDVGGFVILLATIVTCVLVLIYME